MRRRHLVLIGSGWTLCRSHRMNHERNACGVNYDWLPCPICGRRVHDKRAADAQRTTIPDVNEGRFRRHGNAGVTV